MVHAENNSRIRIIEKIKRNVILDYISAFITNLNMQSSIWVLYLAYCGLNLAQIGLVEGVYHATSIVFEIPSGAVADLLGRKKSMLLSRVCIAVSCIIMLFARDFWFFALGFAVQALGNNLNSGSEEALVYDSMKYAGQEEQYMRVCGRLNVIIEVLQGIATVAGGILAEFSYFWCYSTCLVIAVLALLPVAMITEVPYADAPNENGRKSMKEIVTFHFKTCFQILRADHRILDIIVYYSTVFAAETVLFFYSQQYFYELGYNKIQISMIMLVVGVVSCAGAVMSERIYKKCGTGIALIGALAVAAAYLGYGFRNIVISIVMLVAAGFFNSVLYPVQSELLNSRIPSGQRATLISVNSMFFSVSMILLFPLAGALADKWGLTVVFAATGAVLAVFTVCWTVLENKNRR